MKKIKNTIKYYFLSITLIVVGCFLLAFLSNTEEGNEILLWFSLNRLILVSVLALLSILLLTVTYKSFFSDPWLDLLTPRLLNYIHKPGRFEFLQDMAYLSAISAGLLIFMRFKFYGFLAFIWEPLPNLTVEMLPFITGLLAAMLLTLGFLKFISAVDNDPKVHGLWFEQTKPVLIALLIFLLGMALYWGTALYIGRTNTPPMSYFPELAESFINGQLHLSDPPFTKDLSFFDGEYYVSFPPLAALLMVPRVASTSRFGVNTILFSISFAAMAPAVLFLIFENLRNKKWISLNRGSSLWLIALFALGSALWYVSSWGNVGHVAQILSTTFVSFSILAATSIRADTSWGYFRSAILSGTSLGLAMLSRPHLGIAWLFLLGLIAQSTKNSEGVNWRKLAFWTGICAIPITLSVAGLGLYNYSRFGSIMDFGYGYMLVAPRVIDDLNTYGQFHPVYILRNLRTHWFRLPYWDTNCQRFAPYKTGMSVFITTPGLLLLYNSFKRNLWIVSAWLAMILISIVHLFYFDTGGLQFGYRYSLDFLVIAFCLMAAGFKDRLPKIFPYIFVYSLIINFIGVLWHAKQWCITW